MPLVNPQLQTLRLYAELLARHATLAGTLTLTHGAGCSATGLAAAVSIAGGTSLLIDPDPAAVKATFRSGGLDFLVTNLDEALRVLKNEIRKHTPLSVALTADPTTILAEMRDRGVEPNLEVTFEPSPAELSSRPEARLCAEAERPAASLALTTIHLPAEGLTSHAAAWLAARDWSEIWLPTATTAELRTLDVRLIELIPEVARLTWLRRIPNYQRPAPNTGRALWLTPKERGLLTSHSEPA